MKILSFVTGVWLSVASWLGIVHQTATTPSPTPTPTPTASIVVSNTPASSNASKTGQTSSASSHASPVATDPLKGLGSDKYASGILPLGDSKYVTSGPKKGYVYLCNTMQGGGGAQSNGPWIGTNTWNITEKIAVLGANQWPNASVKISVANGTRTIISNGLPTVGTTGNFPVSSTDPAALYDRNPNSIASQNYSFSLPANPQIASAPGCIYGEVGIMTNGVPLNDAFDAEYRDAAAHEIQDSCDGHSHESGVYHYHSLSSCIPNATVTNVIGWAFDGFPITGPKIADHRYLTTSDLDECHGITSPVMIDGVSVNTYHYVMTEDFPYSVSCFKGKSYEPRPGPGGGQTSSQGGSNQSMGPGGQPPQAAISACANSRDGLMCSFTTPNGTMNGICRYPPNQTSLACVPQ